MSRRSRQLNIPLDETLFRQLEALVDKYREVLPESETRRSLTKTEAARQAVLDALKRWRQSAWKAWGLVTPEDLYRPLRSLLRERWPELPLRIFFGESDLELLFPHTEGVEIPHETEPWPHFKFRLGTDLARAHCIGLVEEGTSPEKEPVICHVSVTEEGTGKEIFASEPLQIVVDEENMKDIATAEQKIPFPKEGFKGYEDRSLRWTLHVEFLRVKQLGDRKILVKTPLGDWARFYIISQSRSRLAKLSTLYYSALSYMEIGQYEKAMELCREAAEIDISDLASKRILAEIFYWRAQGLSGAPGEEPLEESIGKFVEIYNSFYEQLKGEEELTKQPREESHKEGND